MNDKYWSKRGKLSYDYKGEKFYTITPLPFYLKRRKILLRTIEKVIRQIKRRKPNLKVCDFGSGDGFYCCWMSKKLPESEITGFDISPSMTKEAIERVNRENLNNIAVYCGDFNNKNRNYDLVLSLAVLQHFIKPEEIAKKTKQLHDHLEDEGMVVLFEATSKKADSSKKLLRRTEAFYTNIFEDAGFQLIEKQFISFPFFNLYQRKFLNRFMNIFKGDEVQKCVSMNKNFFMNTLNRFMLDIGIVLDKFFRPKQGNTIFVFKKN